MDVPMLEQKMRDELEGVRVEIGSLIGNIEGLRDDIYGGSRRRCTGHKSPYELQDFKYSPPCALCDAGIPSDRKQRRDLRKLEDRLWLRLHQLQEKENELHRQRTAILSRSLLPGSGGEPRSPLVWQRPPPVSPEAPDSPPWQQKQQHQPHHQQRPPASDPRHLARNPTPTPAPAPTEDSYMAVPLRAVLDGGAAAVAAASAAAAAVERSVQVPQQMQPASVTRPLSLRRRPCRPGSAEDTGSGAE